MKQGESVLIQRDNVPIHMFLPDHETQSYGT